MGDYTKEELVRMYEKNEQAIFRLVHYMTCCHIPFAFKDFVPRGNEVYNKKVRSTLSAYRKRNCLSRKLAEAISKC
jgi:hypothetical protein